MFYQHNLWDLHRESLIFRLLRDMNGLLFCFRLQCVFNLWNSLPISYQKITRGEKNMSLHLGKKRWSLIYLLILLVFFLLLFFSLKVYCSWACVHTGIDGLCGDDFISDSKDLSHVWQTHCEVHSFTVFDVCLEKKVNTSSNSKWEWEINWIFLLEINMLSKCCFGRMNDGSLLVLIVFVKKKKNCVLLCHWIDLWSKGWLQQACIRSWWSWCTPASGRIYPVC